MSAQARTLGVVLAAGGGERYGMPKVAAAQGLWLQLAVAALDGGGVSRVPVLIGRSYWEELLPSLYGDVGAAPFLAACGDLVSVECSDLANGDDIDAK